MSTNSKGANQSSAISGTQAEAQSPQQTVVIYANKITKINSNLGKLCTLLDLSDDEDKDKVPQMRDKRSYSLR